MKYKKIKNQQKRTLKLLCQLSKEPKRPWTP
jgi:hypothetical protein